MRNNSNSNINNTLLSYCKDIKEICDPLFQNFGLAHLNYIKVFNDGGVIYLCNNYEWLEHYLKKVYPLIGAFEQDKNLLDLSYVLWSGLTDDQILVDTREIFHIYHGITFIEKVDDGHEFYNLGSTITNPAIINNFINNLDFFKGIAACFREKSTGLIKKISPNKLYFNNIAHKITEEQLLNEQKTLLKRFELGPKYNNAYLTSKELACMKWLVFGKTAMDIAQIQSCAVRTVETHIENIKHKLNCYKQCSLGYLVAKLGIDKSWEKE